MIAVRELNLAGISAAQRNWLNDHTIYTHGFGVVAAYGNQRTSDGRPVFFEGDIPPTGALGDHAAADLLRRAVAGLLDRRCAGGRRAARARLPGQQRRRASRTTPTPATAASRSARSPSGWPTRSSTRTRTSCCPTRSTRTARSSTTASPRERVEKVAPWLTLDGDPYPAVVDGHVEWIVDGYTTTDDYPYSRLTTLEQRDPGLADRDDELRCGAGPAGRQLHPQLGQGDGRRLHRQGHALRLGRERPDAEGVGGRFPGTVQAARRTSAAT